VKIAGTAVLHAPADRVWAALNDPAVLVATIPGCEQLEALAPDRYRMTITAGVASIKGTYLGDVELADLLPPASFTLRASGAGAPGTVSAEVKITLDCPDGATTTVSYQADAVVGGAVGGVGQRVITAVAKRTAAEFFTAVESALTAGTGSRPDSATGLDVPTPGPTVFARPVAANRPVGAFGGPDQTRAAVIGASIALVAVLVGWLLGRRSLP
jgi:carbon monoxide dehydrogenase subunit G